MEARIIKATAPAVPRIVTAMPMSKIASRVGWVASRLDCTDNLPPCYGVSRVYPLFSGDGPAPATGESQAGEHDEAEQQRQRGGEGEASFGAELGDGVASGEGAEEDAAGVGEVVGGVDRAVRGLLGGGVAFAEGGQQLQRGDEGERRGEA